MEEQIQEQLQKIIRQCGVPEDIEISLEIPKDLGHGDLSTNVALIAFGRIKNHESRIMKSPRELAEKIVLEIGNLKLEILEKVEVAGPGFINFWFSKEELLKNLELVQEEKESFGKSDNEQDKKVMIEFTDPNPFKEFHIGHLYSNTVGESLCRLFESQGANVMRVCYQGDVGLHVAKALYGILKNEEEIKKIEHKTVEEKANYLGKAYAFGAQEYEENEEAKRKINELNKKVYDRSDEEINYIYDLGREWSLAYFETIYQRLGTHFKNYYFESVAGPVGLEMVKENISKVFHEDNGAVIFPGKEYGLHNRVFINSLGLPTYEAKELGLAPTKYHDFPYDLSVIVTGNEINEYFKVLLKALSLIKPDLASKTKHLSHGMVKLPSGKMSSRTGNVITGAEMLEQIKEKIISQYPEMSDEAAERVTVGAIKYALLKNNIGGDVVFNLEESISLSGNSGPYLQYTYARTQSVLRKGEDRGQKSEVRDQKLEKEEEELLRLLVQFPSVVSEAAGNFAPHLMASYLFELAQLFNLFYQKHKVIGSESETFRLKLTAAVGQVIKNGLNLLGIQAPEKM